MWKKFKEHKHFSRALLIFYAAKQSVHICTLLGYISTRIIRKTGAAGEGGCLTRPVWQLVMCMQRFFTD